jgi:hypothetical protein
MKKMMLGITAGLCVMLAGAITLEAAEMQTQGTWDAVCCEQSDVQPDAILPNDPIPPPETN